jgi:peptidyl-prolyl cis-trans isomerase B (cyclophilin B)
MSGSGAPKTNGMAITGFVCSLLCWPLGLVFSIIGMNQTSKDPSQGGRGLAIAGLVISIVFAVITIVWWGALATLIGLESSGL